MRVIVKYLMWMQEKAGTNREEYILEENSTIEDLLEKIIDRHANLRKYLINPRTQENHVLLTINGHTARPGARLRENDIVTIMPPVSGG